MGESERTGAGSGGVTPDVGDGLAMAGGGWDFAAAVEHFEDHFRRSVPLCEEGRALTAALAEPFITPGSLVYEIGMATGALAQAVLDRVGERVLRYAGIDRVSGMTARAAERLAGEPRFEATTADACELDYEPCSLVLSYYTLQFIAPESRIDLVHRLAGALAPGGALILFEKVREEDPRIQDVLTRLYEGYKLSQGYSRAQIEAKARSLAGVLRPFTPAENRAMLADAGFVRVVPVHRFLCFEGLVALK